MAENNLGIRYKHALPNRNRVWFNILKYVVAIFEWLVGLFGKGQRD
jgi:hypothetical protein